MLHDVVAKTRFQRDVVAKTRFQRDFSGKNGFFKALPFAVQKTPNWPSSVAGAASI